MQDVLRSLSDLAKTMLQEDAASDGGLPKSVRRRRRTGIQVDDTHVVEQPVRVGQENGSVASPSTIRGITPNIKCRLCNAPLGHHSPNVWYAIWCTECSAWTTGST